MLSMMALVFSIYILKMYKLVSASYQTMPLWQHPCAASPASPSIAGGVGAIQCRADLLQQTDLGLMALKYSMLKVYLFL